ncbi:DUF1365 domain-containing protein [Pseudohongiella spirulinae]|uniref:Chromosome partitioning protein ParA n=1 Tax=Pseudohongiella spirulinae TaxID=1249552 RepID=A0A0S2KAP5_9GAMM|nr:DUF1365 domain-containing protein [Pseudohongiella spirulinae]ALO45055.1 Chromosome partitioning protein ParA [Pseudohongiella spirulinae]
MESGIYHGIVKHHRMQPRHHYFSYKVFMMYLDLDELEQVFSRNLMWSARRAAFAWFRRRDYLGPDDIPLKEAVYRRVEQATGQRPDGPVRLLTNLRYFGFLINPISCYYVFDTNNALTHIVAEVTNTPWQQRVTYVVPCDDEGKATHVFKKQMHVSPFMPMDMNYHWRSDRPAERLTLNLQNWRNGQQAFIANLNLCRQEITPGNLNRILINYPFMTLKVALGIYWQAMKLSVKRIPFLPHPDNRSNTQI